MSGTRQPMNPGTNPTSSPAGRPAALEGIENAESLKLGGGDGDSSGVVPATLPLQLSMFDRVPIVVSARQFGTTGRPSEPFARLLLC